MVNCTQRMFLAKPEFKPTIISSDTFYGYENFDAKHVLTRNGDDILGTYWIAPDGMQGEFVMDIGSVNFPVFGVELINTVNCQNDGCTNTPYSRDRAARAFKAWNNGKEVPR